MLWIIRTLCFTSWIFLALLFSPSSQELATEILVKKKILQILFKHSCLASEYINIYEEETTTTKKSFSFLHLFYLLPAHTLEADTAPAWTLSQYAIFTAAFKTPLGVVLALSEGISFFSSKLLPGSLLELGRDPCLADCVVFCECVSSDQKTAMFIYAAAATFRLYLLTSL